jgi:peptide/nickel transport system permease protein
VTATIQDPALLAEEAGVRSRSLYEVVRGKKAALLGLGIIVFFVLISLLAPLIMPYSPTAQTCAVFAPPSAKHWFGCDDGGIDLLSEVIQGGRISLLIGFAATLVAMVLGGGIGILSGYFGGWVDISLMRVTDYLLVIPDLAFAMVIAEVWGASLFHVIMVIGILEWAYTARIIRAQVKSLTRRVYVKRAQAIGASDSRIIIRHILPQVGPLLIANTVLTIAAAIYLETALAFLGLEDPSATTWGTILQHAYDRAAISAGAWWAIVPDGLAITLLIMGCFLFGRAVEDALNPRLRVSHLSIRRWRLRPLVGRGPEAI